MCLSQAFKSIDDKVWKIHVLIAPDAGRLLIVPGVAKIQGCQSKKKVERNVRLRVRIQEMSEQR